jgi:hypothetical protein
LGLVVGLALLGSCGRLPAPRSLGVGELLFWVFGMLLVAVRTVVMVVVVSFW